MAARAKETLRVVGDIPYRELLLPSCTNRGFFSAVRLQHCTSAAHKHILQ